MYETKFSYLESLFIKVAGLKACKFIKKRLQHTCFSGDIAKFLRTAFFFRTPAVVAHSAEAIVVGHNEMAFLVLFVLMMFFQ